MKAVICHAFGPIESLSIEDIPDPIPQQGEVIIAVEAAGVNFPDGLMVRGEYQIKPPFPFIPGNEVAGTIAALGTSVAGFAVGERVVALCRIGGFAEQVAVAADRAVKLPDSLDAATAAGFLMVYSTSLHALQDKARMTPGETLLVLGAAGGVGLAAVEIGKALGAHVVAAASNDEKCALAAAHGADLTINYGRADLKSELKRLFPDGVDVVYDPVGGALTEAAVRGMAWGGRLLVVGFANGEIPKLPLNLLLLREGEAVGVFLGAFMQREPARFARNTHLLLRWAEEGKLRPHVGASYPLAEAHRALAAVMERRAQGKIILTTGKTPS